MLHVMDEFGLISIYRTYICKILKKEKKKRERKKENLFGFTKLLRNKIKGEMHTYNYLIT